MKKILIITIIALIISNAIHSQGNKSVFFELGGNGLGFSANFDSRFAKAENGFGYRVGIGFFPAVDEGSADVLIPSTPAMLTIPVGINYVTGTGRHHLEAGIGATYVHMSGTISSDFWGFSDNVNGGGVGFVPSIGYRSGKVGKGLQFRAVISPVIGSGGTVFWAGVSFGYKF